MKKNILIKYKMGVINTVLVFTVYSMNFLLFIGSLMTIYVCLSEQRQKEIAENIDMDFEFYVLFSRIMLVIAVIVAIVSFLGCFGIAIDNDYMLIAYVIILAIMMVVKILLSIYLSSNLGATGELVKNKTLALIQHYNHSSSSPMDLIQKKYSCCGFNGYDDWKIIFPRDGKGGSNSSEAAAAPSSCCKKPAGSPCTLLDVVMNARPGCSKVILDKVSGILKYLYRIIFMVFGLEILLELCCVLILLDIGQTEEDDTADEIVYVGRLKNIPSSKNDNAQFEESIDTHDSHLNHPSQDPHTVMREEELIGLYDDDKQHQDDEYHEDESHEEDENEDSEERHEEETHQIEQSNDETQEGEPRHEETQDEEKHDEERHEEQKYEEENLHIEDSETTKS